MSFWPFSNSFNSNSQLQKFLDNIQDYSNVQVDDMLEDIDLLKQVVDELHSVKENYNNPNGFQFNQQLQINQQQQNTNTNTNSSSQGDGDTNSIASSNATDANNGKDSRGAKLIELLLQPHILNGFLDYIVKSVDFFNELADRDTHVVEELLKEDLPKEEGEDLNETNLLDQADSEIEVEEAENNEDDEDDEEEEYKEESGEEKMRRCIQISADILSVDLWVILNRIIETPVIIEKLWLILCLDKLHESSPSVNHLVHIFDQLIETNPIELLNFIRNQDNLVEIFLNNLEVPMIMDFFLRLIQTDKPDSPTGIIDTLYKQDLIPQLIDILKPDPSQFQPSETGTIPNHELFFKQTSATDFIKALITVSSNTALAVVVEANIGPNQLTRQLVSKEIVHKMVNDIMLYTVKDPITNATRTNKHGINNCVGIVIELIRKNNSDYDLNCGTYSSLLQNGNTEVTEVNPYVMFQWLKDFEQNTPSSKDPIYLGEMLAIFSDNLPRFSELMGLDPELPSNIDETSNILGFTKFRISELIAELLHCSNMILINSKKIRQIVEIRDVIREKLTKRLDTALSESLIKDDTADGDISQDLVHMTLDESSISKKLDDIDVGTLLNGENEDFKRLVESMDIDDESDDEEPTISPDNPFVCKGRDEAIRKGPCVGDYFKIKLVDSGILFNIISKFTQYPWHNFFHNVVFDLIQQIFNGKLNSYNSFLISDLFKDDTNNLTKIIVDAYKHEFDLRPGYLGHLILISEEVVKFTSLYKPDLISPLIVKSINSEDWTWFVDEVLLKTREVYNVVLGADMEPKDDAEDKGFDASSVGVLGSDLNFNKKRLYLDTEDKDDNDDDEDYDDDENIASTISEVRIQDMSPKPGLSANNDILHDDYDQEIEDFSKDGFLENLSESSSSEEDDLDEDFGQLKSDENKLTRVKNHNNA